jgi:hypothetical protein
MLSVPRARGMAGGGCNDYGFRFGSAPLDRFSRNHNWTDGRGSGCNMGVYLGVDALFLLN